MNDDNYIKWASKIIELNPEQIQQTFQRLKLQGYKDASADVVIEADNDWLYDGLILALSEENLISKVSEKKLRFTKGYRSYVECSKGLMEDLENILGSANKKSNRMTLAYLAGGALITYCKKLRIPKQASVILGNAYRLREAIEDQFPGYINANLFLFVLNTVRIPIRLRGGISG